MNDHALHNVYICTTCNTCPVEISSSAKNCCYLIAWGAYARENDLRHIDNPHCLTAEEISYLRSLHIGLEHIPVDYNQNTINNYRALFNESTLRSVLVFAPYVPWWVKQVLLCSASWTVRFGLLARCAADDEERDRVISLLHMEREARRNRRIVSSEQEQQSVGALVASLVKAEKSRAGRISFAHYKLAVEHSGMCFVHDKTDTYVQLKCYTCNMEVDVTGMSTADVIDKVLTEHSSFHFSRDLRQMRSGKSK